MANLYSIDDNNRIHIDGNQVPLRSWVGNDVDTSPKPKADKKVRFNVASESRYESSYSAAKGKAAAAKSAAPQAPKASSTSARPTSVAPEKLALRVVQPKTNLFYEMGTVSSALANFTTNVLLGVVHVAKVVVEAALTALRRLVSVPAILIGGAVGAIVGLFSPRWYDSGLFAASGAMTGVSLAYKLEKAVNAVKDVVLVAPLQGAAYLLGACAFVATLPVSIVASPIVAAVKNANR